MTRWRPNLGDYFPLDDEHVRTEYLKRKAARLATEPVNDHRRVIYREHLSTLTVKTFSVYGDSEPAPYTVCVLPHTDPWMAACSRGGVHDMQPEGEACFPSGQLVTMNDGTYSPIEGVQLGDHVLTHDGIGTVVDRSTRPYAGMLATIWRVGSPHPMKLTADHGVLANTAARGIRHSAGATQRRHVQRALLDKGKWQRVKAGALVAGDWLQVTYPEDEHAPPLDLLELCPELTEFEGKVYLATAYQTINQFGVAAVQQRRGQRGLPRHLSPDPELMAVLGYYLAEGNVEERNSAGFARVVSWTFGEQEVEYIERLEAALAALGAGQLRRYDKAKVRAVTVKVGNAALALLLERLCGSGARNKHLSGWLMLLPSHLQDELLAAYLEGDGYAFRYGHIAGTASPILARQLAVLGSRLYGAIPRIRAGTNNGGPQNRAVRGVLYSVSFDGQYMVGRERLYQNQYAAKIPRVEKEPYVGPVHNLTVTPQHTYAIEDNVVFNCSHGVAAAAVWQLLTEQEEVPA